MPAAEQPTRTTTQPSASENPQTTSPRTRIPDLLKKDPDPQRTGENPGPPTSRTKVGDTVFAVNRSLVCLLHHRDRVALRVRRARDAGAGSGAGQGGSTPSPPQAAPPPSLLRPRSPSRRGRVFRRSETLARDLMKARGRRIAWSASKERFIVPVDLRAEGGRGLDLPLLRRRGRSAGSSGCASPAGASLDELAKKLLPKISGRLGGEELRGGLIGGVATRRDEIEVGTLQAIRRRRARISLVREEEDHAAPRAGRPRAEGRDHRGVPRPRSPAAGRARGRLLRLQAKLPVTRTAASSQRRPAPTAPDCAPRRCQRHGMAPTVAWRGEVMAAPSTAAPARRPARAGRTRRARRRARRGRRGSTGSDKRGHEQPEGWSSRSRRREGEEAPP